ncbi:MULTISPECIES: amidohydrolase family protein [unclassified Caballeronia]|uniref:N-acyl-D-amino-acid deacylase family protein n=1 Tax=unclassified Caballeronia TaxID=2646786 RepID=UPI002862AE97|nr:MULTISPECIES: amidohydrolase family protein [unclassified Caballeronia]MDR5777315.1 amidohydrolase family protein [Caballeronia sp. LZ002]MDR5852753.1 amidohydrolase family protein [Caballeronia sp. LZ003]
MTYDLKIVGGTVIDGSGKPGFSGDVGIRDGRIVALGEAPEDARRTIDADGCAVTPGFVDVHTHYDAQVLWDPMLTISPWHGVTSVVMSNCGFGIAPTRPEHRGHIMRMLERVEGMDLAALEAGMGDWGFSTYPEYLDRIGRNGLGINAATFIGHSPVRLYVMGEAAVERKATPEEIAQMKALVVESLRAGALGFSTSVAPTHFGFDGKPVPSRVADFDEVLALAEALREENTGIMHYNVGRMPPWDEFEALARATGRNVCWSFFVAGQLGKGKHRAGLEHTREFLERGLPIYPQTACRPLVMEVDFALPSAFDPWAIFKPVVQANTPQERARIYQDPAFRELFRKEVEGRGGNDHHFPGGEDEGRMRRASWRLLEISFCPSEPGLEGRKVEDVAAERGVHPVDLVLDLSLANDLKTRFRIPMLNFDEDDAEEILRDPNVVIGLGDGGAHLSQLNDACYSTHLLGHWVREKKVLSLERAVHMLTGRPASIFGFRDRGHLAVGAPADVVVFDPATIGAGPLERVTDMPGGVERLVSYPTGMQAVLVNGTVLPRPGEAWEKGASLPGRVLRHGSAS